MTDRPQPVSACLGHPGDAPGQEAFIGRQPIFDTHLATTGYELLYRRPGADRATFVDSDAASAEVALNAFLEFGLDSLAGDRLAFINVTRTVLLSGFCRTLPPERVVLEILETVVCDDEVMGEVAALAAAGYRIALDDYVLDDARKPLLGASAFVKIDIEGRSEDELRAQVDELAGTGVPLLAERVETSQDLQLCRALGFTYFQGYFFARPVTLQGRRVPVDRLTALRVLALLANPATPIQVLAEAAAADVKLSYQLLRAANSAGRAPARPIESIQGALMWIGWDQLRAWVAVLGLSGLPGKAPAVLTVALVRARMCERLALHHGAPVGASWFMGGLFSALDLLFDMPVAGLIRGLPVPAEVSDALVARAGALGAAIDAVIAFERGDWRTVEGAAIAASDFTDAHRHALEWVGRWERELLP